MAEIELRNRTGDVVGVAIVDDEDYERVVAAGPWHQDAKGYAIHSIYLGGGRVHGRYRREQMARSVLRVDPGDSHWPDHRNGNRLDNRKVNLRLTSPAQNNQNLPARTGRFRGVHWAKDRRKWRASARLDGKLHSLGCFDTEDEAGEVAQNWREEHMPFTVETP